MDRETLNQALENRRPDEPIPTTIERWLLRILRLYVSQSPVASRIGAAVESIDLEGAFPETRIVTRLRLIDDRGGAERFVGFTDEVWFTGDAGELLEGDALIEAARTQPFELLFAGSLDAAVAHFRTSDPLVPRRFERNEATGTEVEWIDFPVTDPSSDPI